MTTVANELAMAERARSLPWSPEQEQAARRAYLAGQVAGGNYPRLAAALGEAAEPGDAEETFERVLRRVIDAFA
jgi:hypothetical protein